VFNLSAFDHTLYARCDLVIFSTQVFNGCARAYARAKNHLCNFSHCVYLRSARCGKARLSAKTLGIFLLGYGFKTGFLVRYLFAEQG